MNSPRVTIREARPEDVAQIAKVKVDTWKVAYRGIIAAEHLRDFSPEKEAVLLNALFINTKGILSVYVAEAEGAVIGYAVGGPERTSTVKGQGELYSIYILEQFQRKGIGQLLAKAVAESLMRRGFSSMIAGVLEKNPARTFYDSLGGTLQGRKSIRIGGINYAEVIYHWADIRLIGSNHQRKGA